MKFMSLTSLTRFTAIFVLVASLSACQTTKNLFGMGDSKKQTELETLAVEPLFALGEQAVENENYDKSVKVFSRLIARFPYGELTEQAQIQLAFSQYKLAQYDEATSTITRFIKTYPTNPHINNAYYLKAIFNFDRENRWLAKFARLDISARDLGAAVQSYNDFNDVARLFPNSIYSEEARKRMIYLRDRLAKHDFNVGLYYFEREAYLASVGRAKYVLETYPDSKFEADALALLAVSYKALGQESLSQDTIKVLSQNYPQHAYFGGNWPKKRSNFRKLNPFGGEDKR